MKIPERITTERLVLRQPRLDDAGRVFEEYGRDPEVTRYLTWTPLETIKQAEEFLGLRVLAGWLREEEFSWAIPRADSNMLIGMIACRLNEQGAELGFVLGRRYWNQGYVTEAARAVMDQAFSFLTVSKVWATCDVENLASARVLEK